jgi:hypothetical protein
MDLLPARIRDRAGVVNIEFQQQTRGLPQTPVYIALIAWWHMRRPNIAINCIQPVMKFKLSKPEHKAVVKECVPRTDVLRYRAIKQRAVEITSRILVCESLECASEFFRSQKKKDDLSDSFLTALAAL